MERTQRCVPSTTTINSDRTRAGQTLRLRPRTFPAGSKIGRWSSAIVPASVPARKRKIRIEVRSVPKGERSNIHCSNRFRLGAGRGGDGSARAEASVMACPIEPHFLEGGGWVGVGADG